VYGGGKFARMRSNAARVEAAYEAENRRAADYADARITRIRTQKSRYMQAVLSETLRRDRGFGRDHSAIIRYGLT